jgi:hypothetical protein
MNPWSVLRRAGIGAVAALALVLCLASPARAVTVHDLIALSQAGLSDQVLIALIQADQTVYGVDADQILALKTAGVSESVILALMHNGRDASAAANATAAAATANAPAEAAPSLTIIGDHHPDSQPAPETAAATVVVETVVPTFVPVPIVITGRGARRQPRANVVTPYGIQGYTGFGRFINNGFISGPHSNIGGTSISADGWRIVTPRVVPAHVPGQ